MSDEQALLAAILANRDDDTPRLVYADWLEENGQPERAEFIRVQVELARMKGMDPDCPRASDPEALKANLAIIGKRADESEPCHQCWPKAAELRRRERELREWWQDNDNDWCYGPLFVSIGAEWSRGFVSAVTCSWSDWHKHVDAITKAQPIERVRLTSAVPVPITHREQEKWLKKSTLRQASRLQAVFSWLEWEMSRNYQYDMADLIEESQRRFLAAIWPDIEFELPPERIEHTADGFVVFERYTLNTPFRRRHVVFSPGQT